MPMWDDSTDIERKFTSEMHDAAAEMRHRAGQLRTEADALERASKRLMETIYSAGMIPRPKD